MPNNASPRPSSASPAFPLWPGRVRRAAIPPTRDPFINSLMTRLTPDANGAERFFISTYNAITGALAACINEHGEHRLYRFDPARLPGLYSVAQEDDDTLWLCGSINQVARFTLSSGEVEYYETGARWALAFEGMAMDKATGKLFAFGFPPPKALGIVFDYRRRQPVRVIELPREAGKYMRFSFPNGDGTWSLVGHLPGEHLFVWDPRTDDVDSVTIKPTYEVEDLTATSYMLIRDDAGRVYFPRSGWYDPSTRRMSRQGPRPQEEMTWFGRRGATAFGISERHGVATLGRWDMDTGVVTHLATIANCPTHNVNLTASGKIVGVTLYGEFFRIDAQTGALECSRVLDATGVGNVDCLCLLDDHRVLGTPYITQRFWEVDLETGEGADMGRVAPGNGEIMKLCKVGDKVYMAAYTGGELVEYDPARPARFPENPRVVADPPVGMRPVAIDTDGRHVFYSCSRDYGKLGSILTRYDTQTGLATYASNPLGDQQIISLFYDRASNSLICSTTIHADCESCPPTTDTAVLARLDADTLAVLERCEAPGGSERVHVWGPMGEGRWLASLGHPREGGKWFLLRQGDFATPAAADLRPWPVEKIEHLAYAGQPGKFVLYAGRLEVWDMGQGECVRVLPSGDEPIYRLVVQGEAVMCCAKKELLVLPDALAGI